MELKKGESENMPLNKKGKEIMANMVNQYGSERGKEVFYASVKKGTIKDVEGGKK